MTDPVIVKTTCPRDCYDACGIAVVTQNGAIAKVLGDPKNVRSHTMEPGETLVCGCLGR
jgi:hypothetical protein